MDKFVTSFDLETRGGDQLRETEVILLIIRFSLVSNPFCHVESQPVRTLSLLNVTYTSLQPESFCDLRTAARSRLSSSYSRRVKYLWVGNGRGAINGERGGIPRVFQLIYLEIFITLAITSQTFRRLDVKRKGSSTCDLISIPWDLPFGHLQWDSVTILNIVIFPKHSEKMFYDH